MRRLWITALMIVLLLLPAAAQSAGRALLIGCDRFVSREDTSPASYNNVQRMADTLSGGAADMERLVTRRGDLASVYELMELIGDTFQGAGPRDVNYFYISTHGLWADGDPNGSMTLLLSDGIDEEGVTVDQLRYAFDKIQGKKVLIFDACHSGAVIGKGVQKSFENVFAGEDYKVLCSSGGAEESWFWAAEGSTDAGSGYFSDALVQGMSIRGSYGADANRDGVITLREMRLYLRGNHGASTPQVYPENDDFVLMAYDVSSLAGTRRNTPVTGLTWDTGSMADDEPSVSVSFTVLRSARIGYQIVPLGAGGWDFAHAQLIWDSGERRTPKGTLSPGVKERRFELSAQNANNGFVLFQVLVMENGRLEVLSSRPLCAPAASGDPELKFCVPEAFSPESGDELSFCVLYSLPCGLSLTIENENGVTVARLLTRELPRPEHLIPGGTACAWDGITADGERAPEGAYRIRATAWTGAERHECLSQWIWLVGPGG